MGRSNWKGPFLDKIAIKNLKTDNELIVKRNSEILPIFLGKSVKIHNGKTYNSVSITNEMIGHKFGEFSFTRKKNIYKKKKK